MLRRLFRYPFGGVRSRALAAGLIPPRELHRLARAPREEVEAAVRNRPAFPREGEGEGALHAEFLAFGGRIARSLPTAGREVVDAYLRRGGFENLKTIGRALLRDRREEVRLLPVPYRPAQVVPAPAAGARTLEELAALFPRDACGLALRETLRQGREGRLFFLESRLDRVFWDEVRERVDRLPLFDRRAAREILDQRADIDRLRIVGRWAREGRSRGELLEALPPFGSLFPPRRLRIALAAADPAAALGRLFPPEARADPFAAEGEVFLLRRLYRSLRRALRSPPFDISVPLAALLLKEMEVRDLSSLLAGRRLGAGGEDLAACLGAPGG